MNSAKIFATIVTAIALFPTASWADNISGNTQSADLNSTTIGTGNVTVTETNQQILDLQKSRKSGVNVSGTTQHITGTATTLGDHNIDIKNAVQNATNIQKAK
jgi:hypothetical protein